jgi:ABC-type bacteriocin/lantibiotic exporter with double-glycine peptidase domain
LKGVKLEVGELGSRLSGGQRQRLGIARALYTNPKLLILDEATSALDTLSEKHIVDCLKDLKGSVTIVSIAHRLSTVVSADRVVYIDKGEIIALGTFEEVRNAVPNFDKQVKLTNVQN